MNKLLLPAWIIFLGMHSVHAASQHTAPSAGYTMPIYLTDGYIATRWSDAASQYLQIGFKSFPNERLTVMRMYQAIDVGYKVIHKAFIIRYGICQRIPPKQARRLYCLYAKQDRLNGQAGKPVPESKTAK